MAAKQDDLEVERIRQGLRTEIERMKALVPLLHPGKGKEPLLEAIAHAQQALDVLNAN